MDKENNEFIGFSRETSEKIKSYNTVLISVLYFDDKGICKNAEIGWRNSDAVEKSMMDSFKEAVKDWIAKHNESFNEKPQG
jgi:hypothetical protein